MSRARGRGGANPRAAIGCGRSGSPPLLPSVHLSILLPSVPGQGEAVGAHPLGTGAGILQGSPVFLSVSWVAAHPCPVCPIHYPDPGVFSPHPPLPSWLQALRKSEGKCRMYIPKRFHKYPTFPNHLNTLAHCLGESLRRRLSLV